MNIYALDNYFQQDGNTISYSSNYEGRRFNNRKDRNYSKERHSFGSNQRSNINNYRQRNNPFYRDNYRSNDYQQYQNKRKIARWEEVYQDENGTKIVAPAINLEGKYLIIHLFVFINQNVK